MRGWRAALIAVVVLAPGLSAALEADFGIEAGAVWATQDFACQSPYEYETGTRLGPRLGVFAEFGLTPRLSVDAGLHLVPMGMNYDWMFYTAENRIDYLSIPIQLRIRQKTSLSEPSLYLAAGPRVDILISTHADPWFDSMYDEFARTGLGADVGAGVESGAFRLEFRFSAGFTDCHPDEPLYEITNRAFSIVYGAILTDRSGASE